MAEIMKVMEAAKKIMRSSGNMHQWADGYPSEAIIYIANGDERLAYQRDNSVRYLILVSKIFS